MSEVLPGTRVSPPLTDDGSVQFDREYDVIVVGYGGAGAVTALEALEQGASVAVVDRFEGGGATAISGSVIYAGGGTSLQKRLGVEDSVDNMYRYLRQETDGVVNDETVLEFCRQSPENIDWLAGHGVAFSGGLFNQKTTYPVHGYSLYPSGNELDYTYSREADPAARGHIPNGIAKWSAMGPAFYKPIAAAVARLKPAFYRQHRVNRLVVDQTGRVVGVECGALASSRFAALRHRLWSRLAVATHMYSPGVADVFRAWADGIEKGSRGEGVRIKARKGVVLAAGGFIFNREMVKKYAARFEPGMRLGTAGDDGSGIALGASVGGALKHMGNASAWRFINPPVSWTRAILVNRQGNRYVSETLYGAAIGTEMMRNHEANGILILDSTLYDQSVSEISAKTARLITRLQFRDAISKAVKADSLDELASRTGIDPSGLRETVASYNAIAEKGERDEFQKSPEYIQAIVKPPFYAIDLSAGKGGITPVITLGGLQVDEASGRVLKESGEPVPGLYAAGRNAVGIPSNSYVTGLSVADCIFSGRRAARDLCR
ncbi:FAD-binding protein [Parahaliea maris]|uniref:FAD-binding protein n=1 Tax=Parahaliea maris TaxID=2716870 RepID=A0A5C9A7M6_9GAMM|nr:FAD-binding protein [Parahaliea maris]TXS96119.1 FAD-binding protein [Parahaliea maris]